MRRAVFLVALGMFSLINLAARAEVIAYQCAEPDGTEHIQVDTKTHSASDDGEPGTAQVSNSTIVFTITNPRVWSIQIDRGSGTFSDSDGDSGSCVLEASAPSSKPSPAIELNNRMTNEFVSYVKSIGTGCNNVPQIKSKLRYFISQFARADRAARGTDRTIHGNVLFIEGLLDSYTACDKHPNVALIKDGIRKLQIAGTLAPSELNENLLRRMQGWLGQ